MAKLIHTTISIYIRVSHYSRGQKSNVRRGERRQKEMSNEIQGNTGRRAKTRRHFLSWEGGDNRKIKERGRRG